jgi:hypothetical protein
LRGILFLTKLNYVSILLNPRNFTTEGKEMTPSVRHFIIVCGYGVHIEPWLKPYLFRVIKFFRELPDSDFPTLIFCGGETDPSIWTTEAEVMSNFFSQEVDCIPDSRDYRLWEEFTSVTTHGNISRAAELIGLPLCPPGDPIAGYSFKKTKITIFCETDQSEIIRLLSHNLLLQFVDTVDDIRIETESRKRINPLKRVWWSVYYKLATKFPRLGLFEREDRRRLNRLKKIQQKIGNESSW